MNAPLQLSDSVNIKKRCKCVQHEKKSTDVRIISAWGPVSKRTVAKLKKKSTFILSTFKSFSAFMLKDIHKTITRFPLMRIIVLANNKLEYRRNNKL